MIKFFLNLFKLAVVSKGFCYAVRFIKWVVRLFRSSSPPQPSTVFNHCTFNMDAA